MRKLTGMMQGNTTRRVSSARQDIAKQKQQSRESVTLAPVMQSSAPQNANVIGIPNLFNINNLINIDESEEINETPLVQMSPVAMSPRGDSHQFEDGTGVFQGNLFNPMTPPKQ